MTNDWAEVDLGSLVEILDHQRKPLSKIERAERTGPFPYYGASGVIDHLDDYLFEERLLLVAEDGENLNSRKLPVAFIAEGKYWVNNHAHVLRARPGLADLDFLAVALRHHPLDGAITGAAQPKLTQANLRRLRVRIPAYEVQVMTGHLARMFDDLIENNQRRIQLLEESARLLYREWFVNFRYPGHEEVPLVDSELGPVPEGWEAGALGDLVEVVKDTVDPETIPADSPVVGLEHLPRRSTTLAEWGLAREVGSRRAVFRKGDILFGKIRPYFHKVVEAPFDGFCSTDAVVLRPLRDSDSAQVLAIASCDDFIAHASASANGTKMPRANMDVLMRYPVPRPTESVGQAFEEAAKPLTELAKQLIQTNSRLTEARDLLLPRLVSGDLDISDLELDLEAVS